MLSYRHAYHAGNYADVLKHIVLVEVLSYLGEKEKPFDYIDTHAGAGIYSLTSEQARQQMEHEQGVARLFGDAPAELQPYLEVLRRFNPDGRLRHYPGSPKIAESLMRPQDRGWLFELHPNDFPSLKQAFQGNRQIRVAQEDGFEGLIRLLPPASHRGCILIDPAYEVKGDYERVVTTLTKAHRRFANGIYCLWYPLVERERIERMQRGLVKSGMRRIHRFELGRPFRPNAGGMQATGLFVINPPWTLPAKMQRLLPMLAERLADGEEYQFRCEELVGE
jgi:23S rRNA (adenine2030-N6)-methyltransferase